MIKRGGKFFINDKNIYSVLSEKMFHRRRERKPESSSSPKTQYQLCKCDEHYDPENPSCISCEADPLERRIVYPKKEFTKEEMEQFGIGQFTKSDIEELELEEMEKENNVMGDL